MYLSECRNGLKKADKALLVKGYDITYPLKSLWVEAVNPFEANL